jgi:hypothetical protein
LVRGVEDEVRTAAESVRRRHAEVMNRCVTEPAGAVSWTLRLPSKPPKHGGWRGWVHGALDVAGMAPVVGEGFDLANALFYLAEGEWADALLSGLAVVPMGGQLASGSRHVDEALEVATKLADEGKHADVLLRGGATVDELLAMEGKGLGHLLEKHGGKRLEYLAQRQLDEGLDVVSTFTTVDNAVEAVNDALRVGADEIRRFVDGTARQLPIAIPLKPGAGLVLKNGVLSEASRAKILMRRIDDDVIVFTATLWS